MGVQARRDRDQVTESVLVLRKPFALHQQGAGIAGINKLHDQPGVDKLQQRVKLGRRNAGLIWSSCIEVSGAVEKLVLMHMAVAGEIKEQFFG